ncbi:MAG: response regulator [Magnetococcales bacterium]|nr:response regulator [Magnetococcales bacterium]
MHDSRSLGLTPKEATVLIVEDQPEQIDTIKSTLAEMFTVKIATSGELAIDIATRFPVDLILLDIILPGIDGFEVCRRLKSMENTRDIPIIFLTVKDSYKDESLGLSLGAQDFIRKPSNPDVVLSRSINTVALFRANRRLAKNNTKLNAYLRIREDMEHISRHDLKGPLQGIISVPDLLLESERLDQEERQLVKLLQKSGYSMLQMINRSLDLLKMELGTYALQAETFDLLEVIERVVGDVGVLMAQKTINIRVVNLNAETNNIEPCSVYGDRMLCYSLFHNLIKNAIEAAPTNDQITVQLINVGTDVSITLTNSGEVPEEIRDTFFDKYSTHGKKQGTGVGTYSARLAATIQNGSLQLDTSKLGKTSLIMVLPRFPKSRGSC